MASYVNGRLGGFPYQCVREGNEVKLRVWIDGLIYAADINYAMTANGVGKTGITPLMLVAMRGHAGCVDLLLQRGADLNFQYKHGLSALMYAAKANHPAVVQRLLKAGADMAARSANGQTALQIAKEKHSRECVEVFLSHLNGRTPKASNFSKGDLLQIHCVDEEEAEREEVGEVRNLVGTICMVTMVAEWGLWLNTPDRRMPVAVVSYRMLQQYSRNDEIPWSWQLWATAGLMWRGLRASHRMHHLQQAEGHRLASLSADAKVNYCLAPRCRPSISFCICLCAGLGDGCLGSTPRRRNGDGAPGETCGYSSIAIKEKSRGPRGASANDIRGHSRRLSHSRIGEGGGALRELCAANSIADGVGALGWLFAGDTVAVKQQLGVCLFQAWATAWGGLFYTPPRALSASTSE